MSKTQPLVTICIPHWQVRDTVTVCLRSIRRHTPDIPCEVIVVDSGSRDDSLDYLRSVSWTRLTTRNTQNKTQRRLAKLFEDDRVKALMADEGLDR